MSRKHLAHRTVAPRLSELFDEVYNILTLVHPDTKAFGILFRENNDDIQTRILPMDSEDMDEMFEISEKTVGYAVQTDEENNFVKGEER